MLKCNDLTNIIQI